jgi:hypothetical protein
MCHDDYCLKYLLPWFCPSLKFMAVKRFVTLFTVTFTAVDVAIFPSASRALAVVMPLPTALVIHETE